MHFDELRWGGRRPGAGRPKKKDAGVSHQRRERLSKHHPVHVTLRVGTDIPPLRTKRCYRAIAGAMHAGRQRPDFRLVHQSVQHNHIHLIVEADDRRALSRGMQGLSIRIARALNKALGRAGRVFADRYHAHVLRTPPEIRAALAYVLLNWRHHAWQQGRRFADGWIDFFCSGRSFDGWRRRGDDRPPAWLPDFETTVPPRRYLLARGWRQRGLIDPAEVPGRPRGLPL